MALRKIEAGRLDADLTAVAGVRDDGPGWTRRVFSEPDRAGRALVAQLMSGAGLETTIDAVGNVIGRLAGTSGARAALVTGSHTDTVPGGGRFDGVIGVIGAIEAVRALREQGVRLRHDLVVVDFLGEEPNDQGMSCVGSRALAGTLLPEHLGLTDDGGETLAAAIRRGGGDPEAALGLAWSPGEVHRYYELHIEQGPHLERLGRPIGVVDAIVGIRRFRTRFSGRADHAGTMPMSLRHDAGLAAAESALAVESLADGENVATTGWVELAPGATNVVPASALMSSECRSTSLGWLEAFQGRYAAEVEQISARRQVEGSVSWLTLEPPTPMDAEASRAITLAAGRLGLAVERLASYAGHDAVQMAHLGPCAMVFVPSRGGRSHTPDEWTDLDQVTLGVQTLVETLVIADES
ncbi:MAG TPA: M20 family metallo-hydrolase [Acidimicrobiales bacterium]|nr:M20 family metallo-hydrolase [Acidimicrobiales bacterium]